MNQEERKETNWSPECEVTEEDYCDEKTIDEFPINTYAIKELCKKGILFVLPIERSGKSNDALGVYVEDDARFELDSSLKVKIKTLLKPIGTVEIKNNKFDHFNPQEYSEDDFGILAEIMKYDPKKEGEKYEKKKEEYSIDFERDPQIIEDELYETLIKIDPYKFIKAIDESEVRVVEEDQGVVFYRDKDDNVCLSIESYDPLQLKIYEACGNPEEVFVKIAKMFGYISEN